MSRVSLVFPFALAAALTGCSKFRDLFSAHADVVAEAAGQELTPQRLSQIMAGGKAMRANRDAAMFIANVWVDYALFANAVAEGKLPRDSASVAQALWPELAELKGNHWHDSLLARRSKLSPDAVDSTYQANNLRVLQHILFRVPQNATPAVRTVAHKKAEGTLARIKRGADFGRVAAEVSEDPGSKRDNGYLPPSPKGRFVAAFDSVGWTLPPGGVSGIVETPFGFHIIKRPEQDAVRDRLKTYLTQSAGTRLDSIYMDSLATSKDIKVVKGAAATMRQATEDPDEARTSTKPLVTYKGGALTVAEYMRWVRALPPQYMAQLKQANDSMLTNFARILAQNVLLLQQADSAKITVTPEEWKGLAEKYRTQLDSLRIDMGLDTAALWDSSASAVDRNKVAELKVDQYFDRLVSGKTRLRPVPSALAALLRDRSTYRIYDAGINRAVELAEAQRSKTDSSKAKAGPVRPAPGPAPIPGVGQAPGGAPKPSDSAAKPAPKGGTQSKPGRADTAGAKR
jgi:PPIC-type peptidyl-prolyl cis-trans isomerase-like protein